MTWPPPQSANSRAVRCVETGREYKSQREASQKTGTAEMQISKAVKTGKTAGTFHWQRVAKAGPQ